MAKLTLPQAINQALREEMKRDELVFVIGEFVTQKGNPTGATSGLLEEFGDERVKDTPLSETAIAGAAAAAALGGTRPICDMWRADFMVPALDEVLAKMGLWRGIHGAADGMSIPVVVLASFGGYHSSSGEHARSPLAWFMHGPGLKVVVPTSPYDAKGLMKTAVRDNNPVVFLYHGNLGQPRFAEEVPEEEYLIPFGQAKVVREGTDVTIVAVGWMVALALEAADELAKDNVSVEIIDPRTLKPFDIQTIVKSVRKTNRVVVVDEDHRTCGVGAEIAAQIYENAFDALDAAIQRVGAKDVPIPTSRPLEHEVLPQVRDILEAVRVVLGK